MKRTDPQPSCPETYSLDPAFDPAPQSKRRWGILTLTSFGFLLSLFYRVSTAVITPQLTSELGLTSAELGQLAAAFFYAFALSQIPLGLALDRYGPRIIMTGLGLTGVAGALTFASAEAPWQAMLGRLLLGVGMSCNLMGSLTLMASWFPINRFGFVSGLITALGTLGNILATTPLAFAAELLGWRGTFYSLAALNFVQVVFLFMVVRNRPQSWVSESGNAASPKGLFNLFKTYSFWAISWSTFVRYGFFVAIQGLWAGPFLIYGLGWDQISTGNALFWMGVGLMIGMPLSGRLSDRVLLSRKHVIWPSLIISALISLSIAFWSKDISHLLVYFMFFLIGFFSGPGQIMYAHIKELAPPEMTARAMTGINLFTMMGSAIFTQALGLVIQGDPKGITGPEGFAPIFYVGAACLALVTVLYLFTPDARALKNRKK
ncbi:MFS transporter [Dethiosulfatarculus sandiegensis]|uniref:Thiamine biosynthesis protein ThiF n=1 Tax=Dethiosulfatarculus sandiegensis TaxID=1429043 RepID=A0A0D2JFX0_9BACT|nr:MFS transporter [Dethiosulfatarculus sandiegensis]KIX14581.1 thiamine biosynthesis protein ThiF [Dethiosulfatarculus sandiegensis]